MTVEKSLTKPFLAFAAGALVVALAAAPAYGQATDTDAPAGASSEDTEGNEGGLPGGLDFGDGVTIDEDGTVTWNVETDTGVAEQQLEAPAVETGDGIAGTGGSDGSGETGSEPSGASEGGTAGSSRDGSDAAGSGNNLARILGVAGTSIAALVGLVLLIRTIRDRRDNLDVVEEVIDPAEPLGGGFVRPDADPAYAGATDGGAYEAGGAAYAQYTAEEGEVVASAAAGAGVTAAATGTGSKFDQIRAQVVDIADKGLADAGHDRAIAKKLEAAGSKMRPGEWLVMAVAGTVGAFFGVSFLLGWLIGAFAGVVAAAGFWMGLNVLTTKRQKAFAEDLPETLQLIAGSLRGGLSMMQAIQTVADEADEPTSSEFQRIVTETRLGRDLALSFRDLANRMASADFEWVVTAIEIHREVGGDLASILDKVSSTIRQRNRVRGQVKALSAEGRVSGLILFLLPLVMVFVISMSNREYLNEMLNETSGQIMLVIAGVLLLVGGVWLKRLARFVY